MEKMEKEEEEDEWRGARGRERKTSIFRGRQAFSGEDNNLVGGESLKRGGTIKVLDTPRYSPITGCSRQVVAIQWVDVHTLHCPPVTLPHPDRFPAAWEGMGSVITSTSHVNRLF